jgi:hypothetical protein
MLIKEDGGEETSRSLIEFRRKNDGMRKVKQKRNNLRKKRFGIQPYGTLAMNLTYTYN